MFKRPGGKSWTLLKNTNQIVVHEENQATNWDIGEATAIQYVLFDIKSEVRSIFQKISGQA